MISVPYFNSFALILSLPPLSVCSCLNGALIGVGGVSGNGGGSLGN